MSELQRAIGEAIGKALREQNEALKTVARLLSDERTSPVDRRLNNLSARQGEMREQLDALQSTVEEIYRMVKEMRR